MKETTQIQKTGNQPTEMQFMPRMPMTMVSPFGFVRRFAEDMERMFEGFDDFRLPSMFNRELLPLTPEMKPFAWTPPVELVHNKGQLTVRCDLPGMKKDEIKVELKDNLLTITGERKKEEKEEREGYFRSERSYGSFYREVMLPTDVKADTAEASFHDGVLEINMVAHETAPGRKLEIKDATKKAVAKAAGA